MWELRWGLYCCIEEVTFDDPSGALDETGQPVQTGESTVDEDWSTPFCQRAKAELHLSDEVMAYTGH